MKDCRECCSSCQDDQYDKLWCEMLNEFVFIYDKAEKCYKYRLNPKIKHQRGIEWLTTACSMTMANPKHDWILRRMICRLIYDLNLNYTEEQKYRGLYQISLTQRVIQTVKKRINTPH
jgi:hypothetical protein